MKQARSSYGVILLSTEVGLNVAGIHPVKALYWTAVINGLLAAFLLVSNFGQRFGQKLMQDQPSSRLLWTVMEITTVAMFAARVAMFAVQVRAHGSLIEMIHRPAGRVKTALR